MLSPLKSDSMKVAALDFNNIQVSCQENFLSSLSLPQSAHISEEVVLLMADVLAVLASSENGRQHLLFGEKNDHSDE